MNPVLSRNKTGSFSCALCDATSSGFCIGWQNHLRETNEFLDWHRKRRQRRDILYPLPSFSRNDSSVIYQSIAMRAIKYNAKIINQIKKKSLESYFKNVCPLIDLVLTTVALICLDNTQPNNQITLTLWVKQASLFTCPLFTQSLSKTRQTEKKKY